MGGTASVLYIKSILVIADSLAKAREKAKEAEIDSEINSDDGEIRKRKKTRKIYESDDTSESNTDEFDSTIKFPTPPATQIDKEIAAVQKQLVLPEIESHPISTDGSCQFDQSRNQVTDSYATMPDISKQIQEI